MRGFRHRHAVEEVVVEIDRRVGPLPAESVPLAQAGGRVLAQTVMAQVCVPAFARAAMDGYAVRGEETFGADPYNPALFHIVGASRPGRPFQGVVGPGQAVLILTGAPMPEGADAVVKVESCRARDQTLEVVEAAPPARHVGGVGEDIAAGTIPLPVGRVLRPQDLGVLSALGVGEASVVRRPRVAILVTGDELLPPGTPARSCLIPDTNSVMLQALVRRDGGEPEVFGPLPDDREAIRAVLRSVEADAVLVSGGSSTGADDHAPSLVAELGKLTQHGLALRPASPTGLGFLAEVPVLLLPGNPVSCLCAYDFFGGRIVRRLGGRPPEWPYRACDRPLAAKLVSALGRTDYARVRLVAGQVEPLAISGASILSGVCRADGFVVVPADLEGYPAGATVTVWLYD
jgi:molybdopterin molybdotransferase